MTSKDFDTAVGHYWERLVRCNVGAPVVVRARAVLRDFKREVLQDMEHAPDLFERPDWVACNHDRLTEDGICRACGANRRGM